MTPSTAKRQALKAYADSLRGKRVEGWHAWVVDVWPNKDMPNIYNDPTFYNFSALLTKDPNRVKVPRWYGDPDNWRNMISIDELPRSEIEKLYTWNNFWTTQWEEVEISGILINADNVVDSSVDIEQGHITPVEQQGH